jgi:tetratricopeptide (TPR) repeat protein
MKRNAAMNITPVIPDGYNGPIKQLTCRICKHLFYLTMADYELLREVSYCHECSLILLEELEKNQAIPSSTAPKQAPRPASPPLEQVSAPVLRTPEPAFVSPRPSISVPQPRTIDRDKMTVTQLLEEAKMLDKTWRYKEALVSYEQALQRDPGCLAAVYGKGEMLSQLGRPKEALAVYDDILRLDHTSAKAFEERGWTLISLKRHTEAQAAFDHALQLDPSSSRARRGFFPELANPLSVEPLRRYGLFRTAPALQVDPDGSVQVTPWALSRYLARMAAEAPDDVARAFEAMDDGGNPAVHRDVVDAASRMPARVAKRLVPRVVGLLAPLVESSESSLRQQLREWCYDARDKKGEHRQQIEVSLCFAPLLCWILSWWAVDERRLAMDASNLSDRFTVLCISVVYSGCAIPVAWKIIVVNEPGSWEPYWKDLFTLIHSGVPAEWTVIVLADRGLYAKWLYEHLVSLGWHPFLRINVRGKVRPEGEEAFR